MFPLLDNCGDIHVSQVGSGSKTCGEVEDCTKKIEPTGDMGAHELIVQGPFDSAPKDLIGKG